MKKDGKNRPFLIALREVEEYNSVFIFLKGNFCKYIYKMLEIVIKICYNYFVKKTNASKKE